MPAVCRIRRVSNPQGLTLEMPISWSVKWRSAHSLVTCIWLIAIAAGFYGLNRYSRIPGFRVKQTNDWPKETQLHRGQKKLMTLLFAHPYCPCSQASVSILNEIMARGRDQMDVTVVFVKPEGLENERWEATDLWKKAVVIPGVQVKLDPLGEEAKRFQAFTSGQVFTFSTDGKMQFNGGITPARGHEGDSFGKSSLLALARNQEPSHRTTPVYGCSLFKQSLQMEADNNFSPEKYPRSNGELTEK